MLINTDKRLYVSKTFSTRVIHHRVSIRGIIVIQCFNCHCAPYMHSEYRELFKISVFTFIQGLSEIRGQTLRAYSIHRSDETTLHERGFEKRFLFQFNAIFTTNYVGRDL